jgi:hypothetical protein
LISPASSFLTEQMSFISRLWSACSWLRRV